jgi:cytochrome c oxidase subunit 4
MSQHVVQPSVYVKVFGGLTILMFLTVAMAYVNLGSLNPVVAMTIAVLKALLIVLFFMNVKYSSKLTMIFVACGFFWLLIMFFLIMPDYLSREWLSPALPW